MFENEINKVDENFYVRMKNSAFYLEDKEVKEKCILFTQKEFADRDYYQKYPTIYHLRKEFRGKGYATEAARACSDYAKSRGIKQIISYMKSDNLPSRHVAERNGMTFVKSFTKTVMGKVVEDEVLYMKDLISE